MKAIKSFKHIFPEECHTHLSTLMVVRVKTLEETETPGLIKRTLYVKYLQLVFSLCIRQYEHI